MMLLVKQVFLSAKIQNQDQSFHKKLIVADQMDVFGAQFKLDVSPNSYSIEFAPAVLRASAIIVKKIMKDKDAMIRIYTSLIRISDQIILLYHSWSWLARP